MKRTKEFEMLEAVAKVSQICKETENCEDCPFCTEDKEREGTCCNLMFAVCPTIWEDIVKLRLEKLLKDAERRLYETLDKK